jgi:hypothetical protein
MEGFMHTMNQKHWQLSEKHTLEGVASVIKSALERELHTILISDQCIRGFAMKIDCPFDLEIWCNVLITKKQSQIEIANGPLPKSQ